MAVSVGDGVILLPLDDGGKIAVKSGDPTTGDAVVLIPLDGGGNALAKIASPSVGDTVIIFPLDDGGYVCLVCDDSGDPEWFTWEFGGGSYASFSYATVYYTDTEYIQGDIKGLISTFTRPYKSGTDSGHSMSDIYLEMPGYAYYVVRYPPDAWTDATPMRKSIMEVDFRYIAVEDTVPHVTTQTLSFSVAYDRKLGYEPNQVSVITPVSDEINTVTLFIEDRGFVSTDFGGSINARVAFNGVVDSRMWALPRYLNGSNYIRNVHFSLAYSRVFSEPAYTYTAWMQTEKMEVVDARIVSKYPEFNVTPE